MVIENQFKLPRWLIVINVTVVSLCFWFLGAGIITLRSCQATGFARCTESGDIHRLPVAISLLLMGCVAAAPIVATFWSRERVWISVAAAVPLVLLGTLFSGWVMGQTITGCPSGLNKRLGSCGPENATASPLAAPDSTSAGQATVLESHWYRFDVEREDALGLLGAERANAHPPARCRTNVAPIRSGSSVNALAPPRSSRPVVTCGGTT